MTCAMDWDLVIFDCDGVLVDSEPIAHRLLVRALDEAGLSGAREHDYAAFLGGKLTQIRSAIEQRFSRTLPADWVERIYEQQFAAFRRELEKIDGVDTVLDALDAASVPYCVGSNGPPEKMEVTLGLTGLAPRFTGRVFSADHVGVPKPAPDLYLHCADRMRAHPARCAVIEDSPRGATAGVAAGMTVYGFAAASDAGALRRAGCRAVFDTMADLVGLLGCSPA